MSNTNVQECNCCQTETDCIGGLCELCSVYNYELQKQSDLLTLGLLQEKTKVSSLTKEFSKAVTGNEGYVYPKNVCKNQPPEQYRGWNACLSCRFSPVCKLLFNQ